MESLSFKVFISNSIKTSIIYLINIKFISNRGITLQTKEWTDHPISYSPESSQVCDFRKRIYKDEFKLNLSYMDLLSYSDYKKQLGYLKHF